MRPTTSLAAVSSVGKHTARESEAPNAVRMEKSAWRAPTSDFGPGSARNPGHYFPGKTLSARWAQTLCPEPALARAWRADRFPAGHKPQHARSSGLEKKLAWIVTGVVDPGTGLTEANDRGTKFPRSRFSDGSNPPRPIGQLFPRQHFVMTLELRDARMVSQGSACLGPDGVASWDSFSNSLRFFAHEPEHP